MFGKALSKLFWYTASVPSGVDTRPTGTTTIATLGRFTLKRYFTGIRQLLVNKL